MILSDYHNLDDEKRGPAYLTGVTILFGIARPDAPDPDQLEFGEQDPAMARVVWSIMASSEMESLENETTPCATADDSMMPTITNLFPTQHSTHHLTQQIVAQIHAHGGGTDPRLANMEMELALQPPLDDDVIAYVRSVMMFTILHNDCS
jgi:hypothetical protein